MKMPSATRLQRIELLIAIVLTVILVALHLFRLASAGPLWRDEISSLTLATQPNWDALWKALIYDPFPALFFTTLRTWHGLFGGSDFALRSLGCLIGFICLAGFWVSARWTNRRAPLLTLALLGFSPTLIIWGDSLRPYGVAVFCIVLVFGALWRVVNDPRPVRIVVAAALAVLSVQAILTNALLLFACGTAAAFVAARRRQWGRAMIVLGVGILAGLSLLPYANVLRATSDWAEIRKFPLPLGVHVGVLAEALQNAGNTSLWLWIAVALAAVTVTIWSQWRSRASAGALEDRDARLYALLAAVLGCFTTILFFCRLQWPSNIWYYLPMLALVAVAFDQALDFGARSQKAASLRIVAAIACVLSSIGGVVKIQERASNLDVIGLILEKHAAPDDLIVVYPFVDGITFKRYFHGTTPWLTIPKIDDLGLHRWDQLMEQARTENAIAPVLDRINATLRSGRQVWVATTFPLVAPAGSPPPVLPLRPSQPRRIGYFLGGWREHLIANLREHTEHSAPINVPLEQPVSRYERSHLFVFSGWKDSADPTR